MGVRPLTVLYWMARAGQAWTGTGQSWRGTRRDGTGTGRVRTQAGSGQELNRS